jgi:outer membrane protein assembly factor BamB
MRGDLPSRLGRAMLWAALALAVVFAALAAYQKFYVERLRFVPDEDLLEELADATLEPPAGKPDPAAWPQWLGPDRDGATTAPDLLTDWPRKGPAVLWRGEGGDGYSSFAVEGGRAYSMLAAGSDEAVVCWDAGTGKERWRHAYEPGGSFQYGGPRATPTLAGDRLYTVSPAGVLMCLAAGDGKVLWQRDLRQELGGVAPKWGYAFSPLVQDGRVFAQPGGSGRALAAFAAGDGKLLWSGQDDPAGYSSPVSATIDGVPQVVFFTGTRLVGMTPAGGKLLWEFPWENRFQVNAATPQVVRARAGKKEWAYLFITSGYGKGCALVKVARRPGGAFAAKAVYESNELCCHFATPVRQGEHLYGLDEERDLTCLALRTGKAAWRQRGFKKGSLIRVDARLLVLGEDGRLSLLRANPERFEELGKSRPLRNKCWTLPALAGGRLFLRDQRQVLCLDLRTR